MRQFLSKPLHAQLIGISAAGGLLTAAVAMAVLWPATLSLPDGDSLRLKAAVALSLAALVSVALGARAARRWRGEIKSIGSELRGAAQGSPDLSPDLKGIPSARVTNPDLRELTDAFGLVVQQLHEARSAHRQAQEILTVRTRTMDRLMEFSQTIQGAGRSEQVFASLAYFLRSELQLAGMIVLSHEPEGKPATFLRACWPEDLVFLGATAVKPGEPVDLDAALCPCLRQNLPKQYRPDSSPVRCSTDALMNVEAIERVERVQGSGFRVQDSPVHGAREGRISDYPAYCIPFTIGRKVQVVVHMLLGVGREWTEEGKQLAQTYVNTAQSSLVSLAILAEAEQQSMTDSLTALYNRRSMDDLLLREVSLAERHSQPLSLVMIDLDKFKEINDAHGHAAGDHLLRAFADCVRMTLRKTDLAFRYGGDEFVIALPQTPLSQAQQVVQKLRQAFASVDFSHAIAHMGAQPTLSIGLAERSKANNVLTMQQMLGAADAALYQAKAAERNCVRVYHPPTAA